MSTQPTKTFIDAPFGWMYGFPKEVDLRTVTNLKQYLIRKGYPKKETQQSYFYIKIFWGKD
jgi:hypothetical protein